MRIAKVFQRSIARHLHVAGDCSHCGHSIIYHLPLVGCTRCSCDEFH